MRKRFDVRNMKWQGNELNTDKRQKLLKNNLKE